ncbi:putative hexokinase family protein [Lyophyllum shimeji]|uniref:Phosphotransferase n=1 Tax=Lyophyllum shimeji TaxID=47721 RepID=A0A9P3PDG8_LYOSH|nr:putative hexokinase family protein [Lyophyllum shimeji]
MPPIPALSYDEAQKVYDDIDRSFHLTPERLFELTKSFLHEFSIGLREYGHPMAMIPTFVTGVPNGSETGTFLALDLGGTNLRVCEVVLNGDKTFSLRQQKYKVSESLKTGEAEALFDYLADSVDAFLTTHAASAYTTKEEEDVVHLGLTFSFPVEQTALNSGKILTWTKGFSAKNAVGRDVVQLLQEAFDRKHMHVKCIALVNDTVGALLCRAYTAGGCLLGAIFGTGTNGAYVEEVAKITKLGNHPAAAKGGYMIVNTEWGAFNNSRSHLPSTPFDNTLDRLSINPNFQAFEKFVSGMYLGEITRNILTALVDAAPKPLVFGGKSTSVLNTHYGLDTSVMSEVEDAWEGPHRSYSAEQTAPDFSTFDEEKLPPNIRTKLERIRAVTVKQLGFQDSDVTLKDAAIVRWVCSLVARRAALLSGVAVATVLIQTGYASFPDQDGVFSPRASTEPILIGVDGSLIEHYPNFQRTLRESLRCLVGEEVEKRVDIGMAKDGSGVGAALSALQSLKQGHR